MSVTVTDLKTKSVPIASDALAAALHLQEHHGWQDYLMPTGDVTAVCALLTGNAVGSFMVLDSSPLGFQRWLWMSPEANQYAWKHLPRIFEMCVDVSSLDPKSIYAEILTDLGRTTKGRKYAANVVA